MQKEAQHFLPALPLNLHKTACLLAILHKHSAGGAMDAETI